jgi:3,5-epimerase/4-reductase
MKKLLLSSCLTILSVACHAKETVLLFGGKTGWIGQKVATLLQESDYNVICATARLEDRRALEEEILAIRPDYIVNTAGVTGRPNVDWCESHQQETLRTNIIGTLNLADISSQQGIHLTNLGTGCIYEYDEEHPIGGKGFTEDDEPNFAGSFYSMTKIFLDKMLKSYPNVLNLRLRMPVSDDLHERNFITKITRYQKVINVPNSMSVLHDLLPLIPQMMQRGLTGNYNFVNPGTISHNEILDLYKAYIDPTFTYANFSIVEQNRVLAAKRSNNHLDAGKLLQEFPQISHIKTAMIENFKRMQSNIEK